MALMSGKLRWLICGERAPVLLRLLTKRMEKYLEALAATLHAQPMTGTTEGMRRYREAGAAGRGRPA
jgi:hypothetical protein